MKNKKGFLKTIILIIIALALIKIVWGYDILEFLKQSPFKNIIDAFLNFLKAIWNFLKEIFSVFNK